MEIDEALKHYELSQINDIQILSNGNINKTYKIICENGCYIFQQINSSVFPCVDGLMKNITLVTEHLRSKNDSGMYIIFTKDGKSYFQSENQFYRMYNFVDNSVVYDTIDDPEVFRQAGIGFGTFQNDLSDFDASVLYDVIPDFHNTVKRFENFNDALQKDVKGRAMTAKEEINYLLENQNLSDVICNGLRNGSIPLRVTHNDTKLNNILFDKSNGKPICAIDLDTVMKGSVLFDFGDAVRYGANRAGELAENMDDVQFDLSLFEAFSDGFLSQTKNVLNREEIRLLPMSAAVLTYELALRFLEDYLRGDVYFGEAFDGINLLRARVQIKLLKDILDKLPQMSRIIDDVINRN